MDDLGVPLFSETSIYVDYLQIVSRESHNPTCGWLVCTASEKHTVDGSEIQRSPVEVGSLSTIIYRVLYIPGGCFGFLNHQQYNLFGILDLLYPKCPKIDLKSLPVNRITSRKTAVFAGLSPVVRGFHLAAVFNRRSGFWAPVFWCTFSKMKKSPSGFWQPTLYLVWLKVSQIITEMMETFLESKEFFDKNASGLTDLTL